MLLSSQAAEYFTFIVFPPGQFQMGITGHGGRQT